MIVDTIEINNYKQHVNTKLEFNDKINIVYAENGVGKSTIMESIKSRILLGRKTDHIKINGNQIKMTDRKGLFLNYETPGALRGTILNDPAEITLANLEKLNKYYLNEYIDHSPLDLGRAFEVDLTKSIDFIMNSNRRLNNLGISSAGFSTQIKIKQNWTYKLLSIIIDLTESRKIINEENIIRKMILADRVVRNIRTPMKQRLTIEKLGGINHLVLMFNSIVTNKPNIVRLLSKKIRINPLQMDRIHYMNFNKIIKPEAIGDTIKIYKLKSEENNEKIRIHRKTITDGMSSIGLDVKFDIRYVRGTYNVYLKGTTTKVTLSMAESRVISMLVLFAEAKTKGLESTFILDDPVSSCDSNYMAAITHLIANIKDFIGKNNRIIILTHSHDLVSRLCAYNKIKLNIQEMQLDEEHKAIVKIRKPDYFRNRVKTIIRIIKTSKFEVVWFNAVRQYFEYLGSIIAPTKTGTNWIKNNSKISELFDITNTEAKLLHRLINSHSHFKASDTNNTIQLVKDKEALNRIVLKILNNITIK